ncbi:hypothetical protein [Roseateles sp.]|uniref:hypothetical protein n=1 Tax=Roseateles sp. TaxID=1971397 RepID=UPI003BAD5AA5
MLIWRRLLFAVAVLAGCLSGGAALESAASTQPPMSWSGLAILAIGAALGLPMVLGLQVLLGNISAFRLGWRLFLYAAVYCVAAGLAALAMAAPGPVLAPHAFTFLVAGAGMLVGLGLVRAALRSRFAAR